MTHIKFLSLALLILLLSSCSSRSYMKTSGVKTGKTYTPLPANSDVIVILKNDPPPLEVTGMVQVLVTSIFADEIDQVVEEAKSKARNMGADVIILDERTIIKRTAHSSDSTANATHNSHSHCTVEEFPNYIFTAGRLLEPGTAQKLN